MNIFHNLARNQSNILRFVSNIIGESTRSIAGKGCIPNRSQRLCAEDETPRCLPEHLAKKPCPKVHDYIGVNLDLCCPPCRDAYPRFDDLYYKESEKNRKYAQTWVECAEIKIQPKEMCCFDILDYPPMEKRKKRPQTACHVGTCVMGDKKCLKVSVPGCKKVREPPSCFVLKAPSGCRKRCTKYPSFSECVRPCPKPLRPAECNCLVLGPSCSWR